MADDGTKFAWDEAKGDWKQVEGDEEESEEEEEEASGGRRWFVVYGMNNAVAPGMNGSNRSSIEDSNLRHLAYLTYHHTPAYTVTAGRTSYVYGWSSRPLAVSYTHLTLPTIYSV